MKQWRHINSFQMIIVSSIIIIYTSCLFFHESTERRVEQIYELQTVMGELLHQKMRYMSQINPPVGNEWTVVHAIDARIFAAYLDLRPEVIVTNNLSKDDLPWAQIKVIAILPFSLIADPRIDCVYKLTTKQRSIYQRRPARVQLLDHHVNLKYTASFILCDLFQVDDASGESLGKELPESIGIIEKSSTKLPGAQFISIHYPKNGFNQHHQWRNKKTVAICIPRIIQRDFNRTLALVEFIEYYRLIGIDRFTFYKIHISQEINGVLEFYEGMNIVSVVPFVGSDDKETQPLQGLSAALSDCHYRNSFYNDYEYIGVFDIDELLILKHHQSLVGLLEELDPHALKKDYSQYTSFSFANFHPGAGGKAPRRGFNLQSRVIPQSLSEKSYIDWKQYIVRAHDLTILPRQLSELQMNRHFVHYPFNKRLREMTVDPAVAFLHNFATNKPKTTGYYAESMEINARLKKLSGMVDKACALIFEDKKCPPADG